MQPQTSPNIGWALLLAVFGWLLGILTPVIVGLINNRRKSNSIKAAVRTELIELQHRMVLAAYALNIDYGTFDKSFIGWTLNYLTVYSGVNDATRIVDVAKRYLELSDDALDAIVKSQRDPSKGKSVKYARMPFIESQLSELHILRPHEQTILLEVLEHTKIYNDTVDEARDYFSKTFNENLSKANRAIIDASLGDKYRQIAERAKLIADKIQQFKK